MKALSTVALAFLVSTQCALAAGSSTIKGTVALSPKLEAHFAQTAALYIIARPAGVQGGPPVAVKRVAPAPRFPFSFELGEQDMMLPDGKFSGSFSVTARVSQTGSATPVNAGDLQSSKAVGPVKAGGKPVAILIDSVKK